MQAICTDCNYPYVGDKCGNPACVQVNPEAHAKHLAIYEQRLAEQQERERIRSWAADRGYSAL
jgi:hypothetical protein